MHCGPFTVVVYRATQDARLHVRSRTLPFRSPKPRHSCADAAMHACTTPFVKQALSSAVVIMCFEIIKQLSSYLIVGARSYQTFLPYMGSD